MGYYLKCTLCGAEYAPSDVRYVCPKHGDEGILDTIYDYKKIAATTSPRKISDSRDFSIWRYADLLPLDNAEKSAPPLQVGWTPLYHAKRLGEQLGLTNLYIKDDGRNPTASFKDRASAVVVAKARELGVEIITTASTGNAGAALAGLAAAAQMSAVIFVPETAPQAKIAQLLIFGSRVILVKGNYDQAFDLCLAASKEFGWYCRNTGYNPYTVEGKKTAAFEICEQLPHPLPPFPPPPPPPNKKQKGRGGGGEKGGGGTTGVGGEVARAGSHFRFRRRWQHHQRLVERAARSRGARLD